MRMSGQHFNFTDPAQQFPNPNLVNKFLYNGKELQVQTNYYDYGFRQMDPQLGRWHVVDAMAEQFISESPYAYVSNNPISRIDHLGLWGDEEEKVRGHSGGTRADWTGRPGPQSHGGWGDEVFHQSGFNYGFGMASSYFGYRYIGGDYYDTDGNSVGWDEATNWAMATDYQGSYVGIDAQNIVSSIQSGFAISVVDFNGDMRLVSHTEPLVAGYFNITSDGIEYFGNASVYLAGADASISENRPIVDKDFSFGEWLEGSWLDQVDSWGFRNPPGVVRLVVDGMPITSVFFNARKMIYDYDDIRQIDLTNASVYDHYVSPSISIVLSALPITGSIVGLSGWLLSANGSWVWVAADQIKP